MNIQIHELRELAEALNPKPKAVKWEYNVQGFHLDLGRETEDCLDRFGAQAHRRHDAPDLQAAEAGGAVLTASITRGMTFSEYCAIDAMSCSALKDFATSPGLYKYRREHPLQQSPAMRFGSAVDCRLFRPHDYGREYPLIPRSVSELPFPAVQAPHKLDYRTKEGKAFKAEHEGKVIVRLSDWDNGALRLDSEAGKRWREYVESQCGSVLTDDEWMRVADASEAIRANPLSREMLGGDYQICVQWTDEDSGVLCKCLIDSLVEPIAWDLKTTYDAHPKSFPRTAFKFRYHWQAAMYTDGLRAAGVEVEEFRFAVVESTSPHRVEVYTVPESVLEKGRDAYQRKLAEYAEIRKIDFWPTSTGQLQTLEFKRWMED